MRLARGGKWRILSFQSLQEAFAMGIRTSRYNQAPNTPPEALPYLVLCTVVR